MIGINDKQISETTALMQERIHLSFLADQMTSSDTRTSTISSVSMSVVSKTTHEPPQATTTYHEPPRPITSHHDLPRATTSHHDLPRANTTQKFIHFKNLRNTTSQKLRSIKTVIKQLINYKIEQVFCLAYDKIQQLAGVGLLARVVGWSSLVNDLFCWV